MGEGRSYYAKMKGVKVGARIEPFLATAVCVTAGSGGWLRMVVGAPMWACADSKGDDIVSAVGTSCMQYGWGWQHNGAVVHQQVHHWHDDGDAVVIPYSMGSLSVCASLGAGGVCRDAGVGRCPFMCPIGLQQQPCCCHF